MSLYGQAIPPDTRQILRLDSSKHNMALIDAMNIPTFIEMVDDVKGGCWTDVSATKAKIELFLLDRGWKIVSRPQDAVATIQISVIGGALTSQFCSTAIQLNYLKYAFVSIEALSNDKMKADTLALMTFLSLGGISSTEKSSSNAQIFKLIQSCLNSILVEIKKAKNQLPEVLNKVVDTVPNS